MIPAVGSFPRGRSGICRGLPSYRTGGAGTAAGGGGGEQRRGWPAEPRPEGRNRRAEIEFLEIGFVVLATQRVVESVGQRVGKRLMGIGLFGDATVRHFPREKPKEKNPKGRKGRRRERERESSCVIYQCLYRQRKCQ